jgi:serine O-acetyltransferase
MKVIEYIKEDIQTVLVKDPAAKGALEIILLYPGVQAVWLHRLAHWLWQHDRLFLGRLGLAEKLLFHFARAFARLDGVVPAR